MLLQLEESLAHSEPRAKKMSTMLLQFEESLAHILQEAGLVAVERVTLDGVSWLEYRGSFSDDQLVLNVFHIWATKTITVEMWRRARVQAALREGHPDRLADRQSVWQYDSDEEAVEVGRSVTETVVSWFE